MDTRIYVMTHKEYTKPEDDLYISLHVGKALKDDLEYQGDNTGDNISEKNKNYCELTGIYWLWKNVKCDIVGICHYRRYFVCDENFITKEYIEKILSEYDVIVPNSSCTEYKNLGEHYQRAHHGEDLELCREVIEKQCPEYLDSFDLCMNCNLFSVGNMMIAKKEIFDDYCSWLFSILFEAEKKIDIKSYDEFQARVMGYLSERLLRVWLLNQSFKIREEEVRMINPLDGENAVKAVELKYRYVELALKDLITLYSTGKYMDIHDISPLQVDFNGKLPVWVCWWQGEEQAPELVRKCIASIRKNIPEDIAMLHMITLDNVGEYITLPSWIIEKFEAGKITLTHLSDILRAGLLYRYGGMWIDATYFASDKIPREVFLKGSFYTQKLKKAAFKADITQGRWSGNFMRGEKGSILFRFLLNAFYMYWLKYDEMIDYYLIDYIIALAYNNITDVKKMIDVCPYSNPNVFELKKVLNNKFNDDTYKNMVKDTYMFKLSHRLEASRETIAGEKTFYGYMCEMADVDFQI